MIKKSPPRLGTPGNPTFQQAAQTLLKTMPGLSKKQRDELTKHATADFKALAIALMREAERREKAKRKKGNP